MTEAKRLPWRGAIVPLVLLALWLAVIDTGLYRHALLVPAHRILGAPFVDPDGRQVWTALATSVSRMAAGLALGGSLGLVVGLLLGWSQLAQLTVAPTLHSVRQVALFAWIPLLTSWFGNGEPAKLVFVSISAFFPLLLGAEQGVRSISHEWREVADVLRLSPWRRLKVLVLPAALPSILVGVEIALVTAWIGTIGAEYSIGSGVGLGAFLAAARDVFRMDLVLIGVALMALVGYAWSRLASWAFERLFPWQERKQ